MPARTPDPFRLALFWLGIQAVWGALLGISLQARTIELAHGNPLIAYGQLATAGAIVAAVTQIVVGLWSDARRHSGSRRIEFYVVGTVAGAATIAWFYEARTFVALTIAFVALQAAMNVAAGPYQAIIPDFVARARVGVASSWMAAMQSLGNAAGALAASFLGDARLLAGSLDALLLGTCAVTCAHTAGLKLSSPPCHTEPSRSANRTTSRAFADLFISRVLVYVGFYTLLGYLLFYVSGVLGAPSLESARRQTGILIVAFTLVAALGAAIAARPSDRFDKRLVANAGGIAVIAALGVFIACHGLIAASAATLVAGLGWGIFLVADWSIACRVIPARTLATAMGVWNLAVVLPQIIAPALTTVILRQLALTSNGLGPRVAFALALGETLLGIGWLWRLPACALGE